MFSVYGKLNLFKSDRRGGGGGGGETTEIQCITMEWLRFFVGQSVYCIILKIDYGWLIEVCFLI